MIMIMGNAANKINESMRQIWQVKGYPFRKFLSLDPELHLG